MTETILLTGLAEGIGKTAITLGIGRHAQNRGLTVGYMKPLGTRLRTRDGILIDEDLPLAARTLGLESDPTALSVVTYSETLQTELLRGQTDPATLQNELQDRAETLGADRDLLLVEGSGTDQRGRMLNLTDPELATQLDARVVLVGRYRDPSDIDPVMAAADTYGDRLAGIIFTDVSADAIESLRTDGIPFLESAGYPVLGSIPHVDELAGITVADLATELGAELIADTGTAGLVETVLIGAMGAETALRHFRRVENAAVVTGGDRADIQTAAIETAGVTALVLTGGHQPPTAVRKLARERSVPILLVQTDSRTATDRIETIISRGRTHREAAIDRMTALLDDHVELTAILPNR